MQALMSADEAIGYLIASGGNSKLAAVQATKESQTTITEAQLLAAITNDPNSLVPLTQQLNLLLILNTVESLRLTHHAYVQALHSLSPKDVSIAYTKLLQTLANIARPPEPNPPAPFGEAVIAPDQLTPLTPDQIMEALPSDVASAIKLLMSTRPAGQEATQHISEAT